MGLSHNFIPGTTMGIGTGTWYRIEPQTGPAGSHVVQSEKYFPVLNSLSFSQTHEWSESDNIAKNGMKSIEGAVAKVAGNSLTELASKVAQRRIGGGPHISACSIYTDSSPPSFTVRTQLFSPDGSGVLMALLEELRADFCGSISMNGANGAINGAISTNIGGGGAISGALSSAGVSTSPAATSGAYTQNGWVTHPEWWKVEVISYASGAAVPIIKMTDMHAVSFEVTMFSPFIGKDPSTVELNIGFKYGFRGYRESMSFGGGGGSSPSASSPGQPQSTPSSRGSSNQQATRPQTNNNNTNSLPQSAQTFRANSPLLGGPLTY